MHTALSNIYIYNFTQTHTHAHTNKQTKPNQTKPSKTHKHTNKQPTNNQQTKQTKKQRNKATKKHAGRQAGRQASKQHLFAPFQNVWQPRPGGRSKREARGGMKGLSEQLLCWVSPQMAPLCWNQPLNCTAILHFDAERGCHHHVDSPLSWNRKGRQPAANVINTT